MKLAFLGGGELPASLLQCWLEQGRLSQALLCDWPHSPPSYHACKPTPWEELLHGGADAAIVSSLRELSPSEWETRYDQLRKLTQAGLPLLLLHPSCDAIIGFELEMIRQDSAAPLIPYWPGNTHPAVEMLTKMQRGPQPAPWGKLEQITIERSSTTGERTRVLHDLSSDLGPVRRLLGSFHRVHAIGQDSEEEKGAWSHFTTTVLNPQGEMARWSCSPGRQQSGAVLKIAGSEGRAVLHMPDQQPWSLRIEGAETTDHDFSEWNPADEIYSYLEDARAGRTLPETAHWLGCCRVQEVIEAAERSLKRGRTIELYQEIPSEASTFKGVMAASGCMILLFSVFCVLLAGIVEGLQLPFRDHWLWKMWPVCLTAILVTFLAMQLLQVFARGESPTSMVREKT